MSVQNCQQDKLKIVPQDPRYLYFQKFFPEVLSYQYFFDAFLGSDDMCHCIALHFCTTLSHQEVAEFPPTPIQRSLISANF